MTMAETAVGEWAAAVSQREILIGDVLWRSMYITPCWIEELQPQIKASLWETGAAVIGLSAARRIRHLDVQTISCRAYWFPSTANTVYNNDGSVTIDFRHAITDEVRNGIKAYVASTGRFDSRWLEHVTMQDMSWLRDRRGIPYKLHGAGFSRGSRTLGDVLSWFSIQPGVTRFSPCTDMSAQSIAKRRHFGSFCLALAYNFPSIMY